MKQTPLKRKTPLRAKSPMKRSAKPKKRAPVSGSKRPNADQDSWHDWLRQQGCYVTGGPAEIHHAVGSTGKHNGVAIGQWWVIPLCTEAHKVPHGIHGDRSMFDGHNLGESRKEIEKTIFMRLVAHYRRTHGFLPCPADVLAAVEDYHR